MHLKRYRGGKSQGDQGGSLLIPGGNELEEQYNRVLGDFSIVQINWIESGGKIVKKFLPKLTLRQENSLKLVGVPVCEFQKDYLAL